MDLSGQLTIGKRFAIVFGAMFILVVAVLLHAEYLYYMSFALALLPAVTWVVGWRSLRNLTAERRLPAVVKVGETFGMRVALTNAGVARKQFLLVRDGLPSGLLAESPPERWLPDLVPGETVEVEYPVLARKRGVYPFGWVDLHSTDPLGLFGFHREVEAPATIIVHPRPVALPPVRPPAPGVTVSARARLRKRGEGTDFAGLREYIPGDDMRRVHWKNSAKRGKLTVVEYESAEANSMAVVLDLSPQFQAGHDQESTLEYGVTLAASIAAQCLRRGAECSLVAEGAESHSLRSLAAPSEETRVMDALARVRADAKAPIADTLLAFEQWLPPGTGVVVISPAAGPQAAAAARRLTALGHGVLWVSLVAPSFVGEGEPTAATEAAYAELATNLGGARCEVRQVRRGEHLATRMGVRAHAA
jgi:uncharacterized protein (DUF58 family)